MARSFCAGALTAVCCYLQESPGDDVVKMAIVVDDILAVCVLFVGAV